MVERKIRILLGKLGEGHKEVTQALARNFSEAGFEVVYTELQEPGAIVRSALQESVDHIGITTFPGADISILADIIRILKKGKSDSITVTAGEFLDETQIPRLKAMGVMEFFPQRTFFEDLVAWSQKHIKPAT